MGEEPEPERRSPWTLPGCGHAGQPHSASEGQTLGPVTQAGTRSTDGSLQKAAFPDPQPHPHKDSVHTAEWTHTQLSGMS